MITAEQLVSNNKWMEENLNYNIWNVSKWYMQTHFLNKTRQYVLYIKKMILILSMEIKSVYFGSHLINWFKL
jgi:hypothetical protein